MQVRLDNFVRLPNKILITTRQRDFKADYPIQVGGMSDVEAEQLIASVSKRLVISEVLTPKYVVELLEEADGHPYIIKVLLGEVAKAGKAVKIERIVASKDNILDALFERTYAGLHPVSKRVFLTLCSWKSLVPELAFEAILLRPGNDRMDVSAAIDELVASSFVDRKKAADDTLFLDVALAAYIFGRKKLQISPMKAAIAADIEFMQQIGASSSSSLKHGLKPRIERLFESIAVRLSQSKFELEAILPSLEYVCRQYPPAWIMLARLHEEINSSAGLDQAAECFRRFLEIPQPSAMQISAWQELARIYRLLNDPVASAQAIIQMSKVDAVPYALLSNVANDLNSFLRQHPSEIDSDEKKIIYQDLVQVMEQRIEEANATDLSRIAWLHLHLKNVRRAEQCTKDGIDLDPTNQHCLRLIARLKL